MYPEDSFFTLSIPGQAGLIFLSCVFAGATLYLTWRLTAGRHWSARIAVALVLFFAFEWLSPQGYYTYYIYLLEVPWQLVIHRPPTPVDLGSLMTFTGNANMSEHSRGVLGLVMLILAIMNRRSERSFLEHHS